MVVTRLRCKPIVLALLCTLVVACAAPRYLQLAPVKDVASVDVEGQGTSRGRIADRRRIEAIVAFVNARRDSWYDPQGDLVMMSGWLSLLDAHGKQIAFVGVGPGGMTQSRPDLTDVRRGKSEEVLVGRTISHEQAGKDYRVLCAIVGRQEAQVLCQLPNEDVP